MRSCRISADHTSFISLCSSFSISICSSLLIAVCSSFSTSVSSPSSISLCSSLSIAVYFPFSISAFLLMVAYLFSSLLVFPFCIILLISCPSLYAHLSFSLGGRSDIFIHLYFHHNRHSSACCPLSLLPFLLNFFISYCVSYYLILSYVILHYLILSFLISYYPILSYCLPFISLPLDDIRCYRKIRTP